MRIGAFTKCAQWMWPVAAMTVLAGCASGMVISHAVTKDNSLTPNRAYYFLPRGYLNIELSSEKGKYALSIAVTYEPDPESLYEVELNESIFSDDSVVFEITQKGLLTYVSGKSKDQRGALIGKIAELAVEIGKAVALDEEEVKRVLLKVSIDPTASADSTGKTEVEKVSARVSELTNGELAVGFTPLEASKSIIDKKCSECTSGIRFRPLLPYGVTVTRNGKAISSGIVLLPNQAPIFSMTLARASFVEKETKITFLDGILTKYEITKPSQALGFIQIPIDIAKAIVSIPSSILQFKIDQTTQQKNFDVAKREAIEAQAALGAARGGQGQGSGTGGQ